MNYWSEKTYIKEDGKGFYSIIEGSNVEFIDPIPYFLELYMLSRLSLFKGEMSIKYPEIPLKDILENLSDRIQSGVADGFMKLIETQIKSNFITLLYTTKKKEQIQLLKGIDIDELELVALIIRACNDYGYTFSNYKHAHHPKGFDSVKLPKLGVLKGAEVETIGDSSLTEGQLKNLIEQRKVIVSKFIDKGSTWHCFFTTYNSLKGSENWNGGRPHYHYISDKFGIARAEVVNRLQSPHYNLGNLPHIPITNSMNKISISDSN